MPGVAGLLWCRPGRPLGCKERCLIWLTVRDAAEPGKRAGWQHRPLPVAPVAASRLRSPATPSGYRAENSRQLTRRRERRTKRFKSPDQARRFLSAHDGINNLFLLRRHQVPAVQHRAAGLQAFQVWAEVTGVAAAM